MNSGSSLDLPWYDNLIRINSLSNGDCYFHSILMSFNPEYKKATCIKERIHMAKKLRHDLANRLEEVDPETGLIVYDTLSRGKLKEFGEFVPCYSLTNLKALLRSNNSVDYVFNELVSNEFDIDIYIINYAKKEVNLVDHEADILYKNRDSVVLLFLPGSEHYELVGLSLDTEEDIEKRDHEKVSSQAKTLFDHDHDFIKVIRNRMKNMYRG